MEMTDSNYTSKIKKDQRNQRRANENKEKEKSKRANKKEKNKPFHTCQRMPLSRPEEVALVKSSSALRPIGKFNSLLLWREKRIPKNG